MKRIIFSFLLAILFLIPFSQVFSQLIGCQDFNDGNLQGWRDTNSIVVVTGPGQNGAGDLFMRATDQAFSGGCSYLFNETDFSGDYLINDGCICLCYDFRLFDDSGPGTFNIFPRITFYQGTIYNEVARATFVSNVSVNENSGWLTLTVPICPCLNGTLPTSDQGAWVTNLDCNGFNQLFNNVDGVSVCLDYTPSPTEKLDFDNFCLKPCPAKCIEAEATNVLCFNNGTTDPSDDYWTFDLTVTGGTPGGYWTASPPINQSGPYNTPKVIYPGPISGGPVSFTVSDSNDPNCSTFITVTPPPPCSDTCKLDFEYKVSGCNDNDTPGLITDDYYYVTVTITGTNGEDWMIKQKKLDGSEVLLSQGSGDTTLTLGPFLTIDGDWTIWVFLSNYFDCIKDDYIIAPDNCSACLNAVILNKICYDNGTSDLSDDYWTFDILVDNGPGTFWTATAPISTSGSYGVIKTLYPGLISNGTVSFGIFDNEKPECAAKLVVDPPKPCSERCELEAKIKISDCVLERDQWVYYVTLNVSAQPGTCWMAKKKNADGSEQVLGTYSGPQSVVLGPFVPGQDWTLWIMICNQFDCVRDFYIDAPDCKRDEGISVNSIDLDNGFSLVPNPASNKIEIINLKFISKYYQLLTIDGEILSKGEVNADRTTIDVSNLQNGTYIIELLDIEKRSKYQKKFVKVN